MIDHFMLKVRDVEASRVFYERALGAIGFFVMARFEARNAFGFGRTLEDAAGVAVDWTVFSVDELWLILGVGVLGGIAGVLPAVKGSLTQVADHLGPTS